MTYRLSLLLCKELAEIILILLQGIGKSEDSVSTLLPWLLGPSFESLLCGVNGGIYILRSSDRNFSIGLASGGIDSVSGLLGSGQLAVDGVVEAFKDVELRCD
jgi:hypothetical protein